MVLLAAASAAAAASPSTNYCLSRSTQASSLDGDEISRLSSTSALWSQKMLGVADSTFKSSNNSNNNHNSLSCRQQNVLEQLRTVDDNNTMDIESEDDGCSDDSSIYSNLSSSYGSSVIGPVFSEPDDLYDRRREMLDLSISKIQTMNASNVAVSLRKSLLIYNTMKCLQRDLDNCDVDASGSLMKERKSAIADEDMLELEFELDEPSFEGRVGEMATGLKSCSSGEYQRFIDEQPRRSNDVWSCGLFEPLYIFADNKMQNYGGHGDMMLSSWSGRNLSSTDTLSSTSSPSSLYDEWSNGDDVGSSTEFMDDYLEMWGAWDDINYNPLTNCNLSQTEIMNMFRFPTVHQYNLNNQLLSQA